MTTHGLNDEILRLTEELASTKDRPAEEVFDDALREKPALGSFGAPNRLLHLPTFRGTGVKPGVNLDSNAALLDLMGETEDLR